MYKTQISCAIIVIFIAIFYFTSSSRKTASSKWFSRLLIVSIFHLLFDITSIYTVNRLDTVPAPLNRIVHDLFLGLLFTDFYLVYKYLESIIEEEIGHKLTKHNYTIIPLIITLLGLILLPLYYVESDVTNYSYGPAVYTTYVGVVVYLVLILKLLFGYSKAIPAKKKKAIYIALISEIPIAIYQILIHEGLITCLGVALLTLGIYLTTENPDALLAEQLKKERARADAANKAKTSFLANMSHEIRTPINAVLGMNEMILRETKENDIRKYALDVEGAAKSLLSIINDILDITKIEAGKLSIISVEYDFSSVINDVTNMIIFKARVKELDFKVNIDENIPHKLLGDDIRLRQILVNLLNNAVKYTHKGSVTLTVKALPSENENEALLHFSVKDTGIGIKEEDLQKLCQPFERIEEKRNRNIEGTGLGMSITKQLLGLLESSLVVESEYGKGSEFSFVLKQPVVDAAPIGKLGMLIENANKEYSYEHTYEAPDAKILVVDDNEMNRRVFVSLLKATKIDIDQADSGKACLELIAKNKYDIIFLDHMMPEMDGIETFNIMKQMEDYPSKNAPVVILTANAVVGAREMYIKEGFDEFLAKPIDYKKLESLIERLLDDSLIVKVDGSISADTSDNVSSDADTSELPMIDGLDWKYAKAHFPDESMLMESVKFFYSTIDYDADELQTLFNGITTDNGRKSYQIKVHSMKNSAATIGIIPLAGMAKTLENAARDGDTDTLSAVTPVFLRLWRNYKSNLSVLLDNTDDDEKKSGKKAADFIPEINTILDKIKEAAADMDIDALDSLWEELSEYDFDDYTTDNTDVKREINVDTENVDTAKIDTEKFDIQNFDIEKIHMAIVNFDVDYLQQIPFYDA